MSIGFSPPRAGYGEPVLLYISLTNNAGTTLTGGTIASFAYPPNMVNGPIPVSSNSCGGTVVAVPGTGVMSLTGGTMPPGFSFCAIYISVVTTTSGSFTATFPSAGFTSNLGNSGTSSATLTVSPQQIVTTAADAGPGSLRQALADGESNCALGPYHVKFDIPGGGPHVIALQSSLPTLTCDSSMIDGYSQAGSLPSAVDWSADAVIKVELDGSSCGGCNGLTTGSSAYNFTISGLAIHSFDSAIVMATGNAKGNFLGRDASGATRGNSQYGFLGTGGYVVIGTGSSQDGNIISGNAEGIRVMGGGSVVISGNVVNNNGIGIVLAGFNSNGNITANQVKGNTGAGILMDAASTGEVRFSANAAYNNGGPGIDLNGDGPTPNDEGSVPYDSDDGANNLLNYPVITSVTHTATNTVVSGYLKAEGDAYSDATLEFYSNSAVRSVTEGANLIHTLSRALDANGVLTFSETIAGLYDFISASVTVDVCGDGCIYSSEYSPTVAFGSAATTTMTVTPATLIFPSRTPGTTSPARSIIVANMGPNPLAIADISATGDYALSTSCPAVLVVSATCVIDVTFTPLVGGARNGSVVITSNATVSSFTVTLLGTGAFAGAPIVDPNPRSLDFPPQEVGTRSDLQYISIYNTGAAPLVFGSITVSGDFVLGSISPLRDGYAECGLPLPPGGACDLAIAFTPGQVGFLQGFLHLATNAAGPEMLVPLFGTGFSTLPPRSLVVTEALVFGRQAVGTQSPGIALVITNTSSQPASITELTVAGDFSASDACTIVAANGSCTMLVFFKPTAVGLREGSLLLRVFSEVEPYTVALSGLGDSNPVPTLSLSLTRLAFGNVFVGSPVLQGVDVLNVGQLPVSLFDIVALGDYFPQHSCPATLPVGGRCTVTVMFFPRERGGRSGILEVRSNAANAPHRVDLSGTGCSLPTLARLRLAPLVCTP